MTDPHVIYDADVEVSALIDTEGMRGMGPISVGPNARAELEAFVRAMPPTVLGMSSYELAAAYKEYWSREFAGLYPDEGADSQGPVEPLSHPGDDDARMADRAAVAAGAQPPTPAPADADLGADEGAADQVTPAANGGAAPEGDELPEGHQYEGPCFACGGTGNVPGATDEQRVTCNLCHGSGRLPAPTPA